MTISICELRQSSEVVHNSMESVASEAGNVVMLSILPILIQAIARDQVAGKELNWY